MSIIHDALKKVQQGQAPNSDKTPYIYAASANPAKQEDEQPVEYLASKPNKAKSVLAFICALAIFSGAFVFLYKQVCTYFPGVKGWVTASYDTLLHKKDVPAFKAKAPEELKPLARITVTPPKSTMAINPSSADMDPSPLGATLNIHGVMSNGDSNLVLINDQVYQEGDEVEGVKIVKIGLNTITVINNGKEETIRVKN